jgi:AcrR family transcriptional regulator
MKKKAVLQSTLKLISELGVHNTPMSKIAKDSGVAVGTIYHHFDSKEEILNDLFLEIKREFGERLDTVINKNMTPKETFSETFKSVYYFYSKNPLKFIYTEQVAFTPIISEQIKLKSQGYYKSMIEFLEKLIADGIFRDIPLNLLSQLCYGNIRTLVQMELTENGSITEELLEEAIHTTWISFAKN